MLSTALSPGATLRFRWSSTSPDSPRRHCGAGRSPSKPPGHRRRQVRKQRPPPRAARFGAQLAAKTAEQAHGGLGATSRTRGDQPSPAPPVRSVCENTIPPSEFISFSFFCSWEPSQPVPMEPKNKLQIQELCCPTPPAKA